MDVFALPVHQAAEVFPMMPPDELAELASDIKANGLAHPIVVKDGVLIDGRNRREACRMAGVEPATVELNGADPVAHILSSNIARRHLTKGQRAMATAVLYPEPKRGMHSELRNSTLDFDKGYLSHARTVLNTARELAGSVLAGTVSLDEAYAEVRTRRQLAEADEMRLARLAEAAPDLAELVREGRLSLIAAETERDDRVQKARRQLEADVSAAASLAQHLDDLDGERFGRLIALHRHDHLTVDLLAHLPRWIATLNRLQEALL